MYDCIFVGGEHSSESDADHHYEMLNEAVGDSKNDTVPYDDFDSFDSDVSDETYIKPLHQVQERTCHFYFHISL